MQNNNTKIMREIIVSSDKLEADLVIPAGAQSIILFAHGSGSSRYSTRNRHVAQLLNEGGFATLLVDLLTDEEKKVDEKSAHYRFDISLLSRRLLKITDWILDEPGTNSLKIGYFASSTGAAAAIRAAAERVSLIKAIVSRAGRPDLSGAKTLGKITVPTLFLLGSRDSPNLIAVHQKILKQLRMLYADNKKLIIISGAGHLFEEPGTLDEVAWHARYWFKQYLE